MKLIWCSGFPEIYAQLEGVQSVCHGVVVYKRSMLDWRRGVSLPWVYVHSAIYLKLIWCSGFQEIYAQLEEGVHLPHMSSL